MVSDVKTDVCKDGVGCHIFEDAPKSLCTDAVGPIDCPITCGCCCKIY